VRVWRTANTTAQYISILFTSMYFCNVNISIDNMPE
jgi:hypothetical protein